MVHTKKIYPAILQVPIIVYGTMKWQNYFFSRQRTICTSRLNLGLMGNIWAFCSKADKTASSTAFLLTTQPKQVRLYTYTAKSPNNSSKTRNLDILIQNYAVKFYILILQKIISYQKRTFMRGKNSEYFMLINVSIKTS